MELIIDFMPLTESTNTEFIKKERVKKIYRNMTTVNIYSA